MLVLSRKLGEVIVVGDDVRITVVELRGNRVRLGIDAPRTKDVKRLELVDPEDAEQTEADVKDGRRIDEP